MPHPLTGSLFEREGPTGQFERLLAAAGQSLGSVLVIEGTTGIGKSAFLRSAAERAGEEGFRPLLARCSEFDGGVPFGVIGQLFEPVLAEAGEAEMRRWFRGPAAELRSLFVFGAGAEAGPEELDESVLYRLRHGLFWLVGNLAAEEPLALLVDDAHLADPASVALLAHLAEWLDRLPVVLVVSTRPTTGLAGFSAVGGGFGIDPSGLDHDLPRPDLAGLIDGRNSRVNRLLPLSPEGVRKCIESTSDREADPGFVEAMAELTAGTPLLLDELLTTMLSEGMDPSADRVAELLDLMPARIANLVRTRLSRVDSQAAALAVAVAVLGETPIGPAAELSGLTLSIAATAASRLIEVELLADDPHQLRFAQPILGLAVSSGLSAPERSVLHGRAAEMLHNRHAPVSRIAEQLLEAPPRNAAWARNVLDRAAEEAASQGQPDTAGRLVARALEEGGTPDRRYERTLFLGRLRALASEPEAAGALREAVRLAPSHEDRVRATVILGRILRFGGGAPEAMSRLLEEEAALPVEDELAKLVRRELLATSTVSRSAHQTLTARRTEWRELSDRGDIRFDLLMLASDAVDAACEGVPEEDVRSLIDRVPSLKSSGTYLGRHVRLLIAYSLLLIDDLDEADRMLDNLDTSGGPELVATVAAQRSLIMMRRGRVDEAEREAVEALTLTVKSRPLPAFILTAASTLLWVATERGTDPHELLVSVPEDADSLFARHLDYAKARFALSRGDDEEGIRAMSELGARELELGWRGARQFSWRSDLALALRRRGEEERSRALIHDELRLAFLSDCDRATGIALAAHARLDDETMRVARLQEAVNRLERSNAELALATTLVDLGSAMRHQKKIQDARSALRRGYDLAHQLGASSLSRRARDELRAAGAKPRRPDLKGPGSLTPSESRVARLAAEGLTNRVIAERLVLSEKTVETHLSRAYSKLDISSRRELGAALFSG